MVFPSTASAVKSPGELPKSKPGIGSIFCSPAVRTADFAKSRERTMTSSAVGSGTTVFAPLASATATVVDARRTSMIATSRPEVSAGFTSAGVKNTSSCTNWLLHQVGFALEELRIDCTLLEARVGHDSGQEGNRRGDTLDDEALEGDLHSAKRFGAITALANQFRE